MTLPTQPTTDFKSLLGTPAFFEDPFPVYAQLQEEAPVYWCEKWNAWLVTRQADIMKLIRDTDSLSNTGRHTMLLRQLPEEDRSQLQTLQKHFEGQGLINSDPPKHTRLRRLSNKAFTPTLIEEMRPQIEAIVDDLVGKIDATNGFDLIPALAFPLPTIVIAEMLGAASEDRDKFQFWSESITAFSQAGKIVLEKALIAQQSIIELTAYFRVLIEERRARPKKDLISMMTTVREEGQGFTDDELFDTCVTLLIAGHETTTSLIGNGILELLRHPDQLADLRRDPSLMRTAVEEILRHQSPVLAMHRRVTQDMEHEGVHFAEGDLVYFVLASANRDPAFFDDPHTFDIRRSLKDNKHIAFGFGNHFCLGAPLSRMEGAIAFDALLRRFPNLRLAGEPHWKANIMVRFLQTLPLAAE